MPKINYIPVDEFRDAGFLQEANRNFFHPLGLALEIEMTSDPEKTKNELDAAIATAVEDLADHFGAGSGDRDSVTAILKKLLKYDDTIAREYIRLGGVWDYRDDPEGMIFGPAPTQENADERRKKAENVSALRQKLAMSRAKLLGFSVQPVDHICRVSTREAPKAP